MEQQTTDVRKKPCDFTVGCPAMEREYCSTHVDSKQRCEAKYGVGGRK